MEILKKTLDQMGSTFSSNEFSKRAQRNGLTKHEINNGVISLFLHRNAIQGHTRRMWRKEKAINIDRQKVEDTSIDYAIKLLKSKGFKVLKPVSDWVEL